MARALRRGAGGKTERLAGGGVPLGMEAQEEAARAKTQAQIKSRPRAGTP